MLIPSCVRSKSTLDSSLSRRVNANSQPEAGRVACLVKLIKKGEC